MVESGVQLYLDLLKRCLINTIYGDAPIQNLITSKSDTGYGLQARLQGRDWPSLAHSMIGMTRLDNIQALVEDILRDQTPGDLMETGVWRGGATIFMRGLLKAYGVTDRTVWVADSFKGMPGRGMVSSNSYTSPELAPILTALHEHPETFKAILNQLQQGTSYEEVQEHFTRYGLLDGQVRFLCGWFCDTLPSAPITHLALLRLDGDLYDSTYDALRWLYPKLSVGGYVIVDDYGSFTECRQAVHDYLGGIGTDLNLRKVDDEAIFWRKYF